MPGGTFDSVSPWGLSSPGRKLTMVDGGRCDASWRCEDTRGDAGDRWTCLLNGKVRTRTVTSGRNPGSASPSSHRTCVEKREDSRASSLAHEGRRPSAGELSGVLM